MNIHVSRRKNRIIMFALPDIAFLLLVFLILTVSIAEDTEIKPPSYSYAKELDIAEEAVIYISRDASIVYLGRQIEAANLSKALVDVAGGVHIVADADTNYTAVDSAISALRSAGIEYVILVTQNDDEL